MMNGDDMKYLKYILFMLLCASNILFSQSKFFLSSSTGNDNNNGKSSNTPWKTIEKLNSQILYPGDTILFKSGDTWNEKWIIKHSGSSSKSIFISNYGNGEFPVFDGLNSLKCIFQFNTNIGYYKIENIEFKNFDPSQNQAIISGSSNNHNIIIENCKFTQEKKALDGNSAVIEMMDPSYITINNCEFSGRSQMIQFIANTSTSIARDGHDITITNCNFHDISTRSSANESGWTKHCYQNVFKSP